MKLRRELSLPKVNGNQSSSRKKLKPIDFLVTCAPEYILSMFHNNYNFARATKTSDEQIFISNIATGKYNAIENARQTFS